MNKKAQVPFEIVFSPFKLIIVAFIAVVLFGGLIWVMGILNDTFQDIGMANEGNAGQTGYVNLTDAAADTFGKANEATQGLRLVAIAIIFAEVLLVFVINSFVRVHPAFFIVWCFIVFLAVMLAAPVSNAYESILNSGIYDGNLHSFIGANWFLLNLPIVVLITGIMGGVFMCINILRGGNEQTL